MEQEEADEALVERCLAGDADAFSLLVDRYQRPVYNLAYRMLGSRDDARDVVQTAFLKVLENLRKFDPQHRFFSWLYRIALNESLDQIGRRGRHTELKDVHFSEDDPVIDAHRAEIGRRVQQALLGLNPEHRSVLVLRHFQDLSYEDIGRVLTLADSTVKSRLFEAREQLRKQLTDAPGTN